MTANAARPNPQGSFHYGRITPTKTIVLANSEHLINGKRKYAVNKVSYVNPDTPLKLADYFNIPGIFSVDSIQSLPSNNAPASIATSVVPSSLHDFIEVVFQNGEDTMQSWHLDGYDFWVVGYACTYICHPSLLFELASIINLCIFASKIGSRELKCCSLKQMQLR